jgi:hypothetical protein
MPVVDLGSASVTIFGPPEIISVSVERGTKGDTGTRGSVIYSGTANPQSADFSSFPPAVRDIYIKTLAGSDNYGSIFQYRLVSGSFTWVEIVDWNDIVNQFFTDNPDYLLDYVSDFEAHTTYLKISTAASSYLTLASASSTYVPQSNYSYQNIPVTIYENIGNLPNAGNHLGKLYQVRSQSSIYHGYQGASGGALWYKLLNSDEANATYVSQLNAQETYVPQSQTVETSASTTYVIDGADKSKVKLFNNASNISVIVPNSGSATFPTGTKVDLIQIGEGQVTVSGASGVTVYGNPGTRLNGQWAQASLIKTGSNTWVIYGNTSA